jgi:predicted DsbA family dithiol-disulfide isomerase
MSFELEIEIFSDVICPWCFIGKRRLDQVLASELGTDVTVRWRPYQLYPNIPDGGYDRDDYLRRRYGDAADRGRVPERIAQEANDAGIALRYDLIKRMPNTLTAHRLLDWSFPFDRQHALSEALFVAYFCDGLDVGQTEVLATIASAVGLDGTETQRFLDSDAGSNEVRLQLERVLDVGITGVPGYLFAGGFLMPGAQSVETMSQILERVKQKVAQGATD